MSYSSPLLKVNRRLLLNHLRFTEPLHSRVVFFRALFDFIDFSIFHGVRMHKILALEKENFNFLHPELGWTRSCVPGVPDHLETSQSGQIDPKLKIYVEIIYCGHFIFNGKNFFVPNFLDFV